VRRETPSQQLFSSNHRAARLNIDLDALRHNFARVQALAAGRRIMPVIKANAYGHGVTQVAAALHQADGFAVAQLDEALALRQQGIRQPITLFHGFANAQQLEACAEYQLRPAISQSWQIDLLADSQLSLAIQPWLKVDTGMGRLGLPFAEASAQWTRLNQLPQVQAVGLMMHFANADQPEDALNRQQVERFVALASELGAETSVSNSAALLSDLYPSEDWLRPGIMLYGASPLLQQSAHSLGLRAVMSFEAQLIAINHLPAGATVGYGAEWRCPQAMPVGIVNAGYGDGYPRMAPSGTPVMVNGQLSQLLGRVSMDSLAVDLRGINAQCGDAVELWGQQLSVDEVAGRVGTISYELLCNAGRGLIA
jgi:alanine racemase